MWGREWITKEEALKSFPDRKSEGMIVFMSKEKEEEFNNLPEHVRRGVEYRLQQNALDTMIKIEKDRMRKEWESDKRLGSAPFPGDIE